VGSIIDRSIDRSGVHRFIVFIRRRPPSSRIVRARRVRFADIDAWRSAGRRRGLGAGGADRRTTGDDRGRRRR
jgi:hypothetical protein